MRPARRPGLPIRRLSGVIIATAIVACLLPAAAAARKPIIAYVEGGAFKLYDVELGTDVAAPPVPVHGGVFRFGMSRNGRYVFFNDAAADLHLLDRQTNTEVPLPGINIYNNPAFLAVSNNGLLAFDDNVNPEAVVYNSNAGTFVSTGFTSPHGHRQPALSGGGGTLATTCFMNCVFDDGSGDVDPYVQNLSTQMNVPMAGSDDNDSDEEDPCTSGDGNRVGYHRGNPMAANQKDVVIYDRAAAALVSTPGLNSATNDDTHCTIDSSGDYVAYMQNNGVTDVFKLYEISSSSLVPLPAKPFEVSNNINGILSDPFTAAVTTRPRHRLRRR